MNRNRLDDLSWAMSQVYGGVTDRILINLAKYFPMVQAKGQMTGSFEYQARMLGKMGAITNETIEIIAGSLGNADEALRRSITNAILDALDGEEGKLIAAAGKGILHGIPGEIDPSMMQAFKMYYQQSADKLNLVNTVMLESTQAAYTAAVTDAAARIQQIQGALNLGAGEVITGVSTWNEAMRTTVQNMVKAGITGFIDRGGHHWSPEAYVAMDIRTTLFNTSRAAVWERNEEYGNDLYQVSSHNGARPLCYPWQGKVISRDDLSREVEDLDGNTVHVYAQSETTYGEAAGLFGVNCGHYPMVFIPGVSTLREVPQDEEENAKTYAESQQQRALERKLREEKRDLEVLKAQGASEEEIKAQRDKVRKASGDIDRFCDETGRTRDRSREYTPIDAKWPDPSTYDPTKFPTAERDKIKDWFANGGRDNPPPLQGGIHLGPDDIPPMVQSQRPITPTPPASDPEKIEFGDLFDKEKSTAAVKTIDARVRGLYGIDEQLAFVGDVRISRDLPLDIDVFDLHGEYKDIVPAAAQYLPWGNKIGHGRPIIEVHAETWGYDSLRDMFDAIYAVRQKSDNRLFTATYGAEGTLLHEYGHFIADYFGIFGEQRWNGAAADKFNSWLVNYWQTLDTSIISKYAATSPSEFFAEAFAQSFDTAHPDLPATKMANEIMQKFHEYIGFNPGR